jgi:hypothetical protein
VQSEVGDRLGAAAASADLRAGDDGDGPEHRRPGAGERIAHAAAPAEARREALCRVDTQVRVEPPDDVVDEGDVFPAGVGPAVVVFTVDRDGDRSGAAGIRAVGFTSTTLMVCDEDNGIEPSVSNGEFHRRMGLPVNSGR